MEKIALPDTNVSDFSQARRAAVHKAGDVLSRPVIVAWKDDNSGQSAPEIPGGKGDRWHDYGESNEGVLELQVGNAYHFIFMEAEGFVEPDINLASRRPRTKFLCLNDACTKDLKIGTLWWFGG
jgi:hypothetical protein